MKSLVVRTVLPLGLIFALSVTALADQANNPPLENQEVVANETQVEQAQVEQTPVEQPGPQTEADGAKYITVNGKVTEITSNQQVNRILVSGDTSGDIYYNVSDKTLIYSLNSFERVEFDSIKEGQTVSVFYNILTPQALSMPPQVNPEVIVLHDNEDPASAKVDYFDENSLSSDGNLKLNKGEEILILGQDNSVKTFDEALEKNLVVFYDITTRSLPPQTSPRKIIVLDSPVISAPTSPVTEPEQTLPEQPEETPGETEDILSQLDEADIITVGETKFVALYKVAQFLGYELEWDAETTQITLRRPNEAMSYTFKPGSTEYGYNRAMLNFENAPFIQNDRTYVELSFIDIIK